MISGSSPAIPETGSSSSLELAQELLAEIRSLLGVINLFNEIKSLRHDFELLKLQLPCELSPRFSKIEDRLTSIENGLDLK